MMKHQECNTAIIEFGDCDKTEFMLFKGSATIQKVKAHIYWYPDDITNEEANQEILDLCEHYENVIIVLPIPAHVHLSKEARNE